MNGVSFSTSRCTTQLSYGREKKLKILKPAVIKSTPSETHSTQKKVSGENKRDKTTTNVRSRCRPSRHCLPENLAASRVQVKRRRKKKKQNKNKTQLLFAGRHHIVTKMGRGGGRLSAHTLLACASLSIHVSSIYI